jgi:hypothetical protein
MCIRFAPILMLAALLSGCAAELDAEGDEDFVEDLLTAPSDDGPNMRVSDYISRSCTTSPILGLSTQIAERMVCNNPGQLRRFQASASEISFTGSAILPYLHPDAIDSLRQAVARVGVINLESAFRTVPQQFLIYKWRAARRCNVGPAASPGNSNHETGTALDITNYSSVRSGFRAEGWTGVSGDAVHFQDLSAPDVRGLDVLAFQQLWNMNNPGDRIDEDGDYGPETERRIRNSPARGFARSGCQ